MNESIVICRVLGCSNFGKEISIITDKNPPVNVICGPCGTQITDITFVTDL